MIECPKCAEKTVVKDSRTVGGLLCRRRRMCASCGNRHTTFEVPDHLLSSLYTRANAFGNLGNLLNLSIGNLITGKGLPKGLTVDAAMGSKTIGELLMGEKEPEVMSDISARLLSREPTDAPSARSPGQAHIGPLSETEFKRFDSFIRLK